MTAHDHTVTPGCFRCELNQYELGIADERTPTTEEVMRNFALPNLVPDPKRQGESFAEFLSRLSIEGQGLQVASEAAARRWLAQHEAAIRADQIERDARVAEQTFPLGSRVLGDAPDKIAAAIRAQSPSPREVRVFVTHPHDGHREGETCLDCRREVTVEDVAEALFYAARRDDWGVANEDERAEFHDMAEAFTARFNITERKAE